MDQTRFDDLTRRLGAGATRRAGLKAALGGLLGVAALAPAGDGEAKKKKKKQREVCGKPADPCDIDGACCNDGKCEEGRCCARIGTTCSTSSDCCGMMICDDGKCYYDSW